MYIAVTVFESCVVTQTKLSGEDVELMEKNLEKLWLFMRMF